MHPLLKVACNKKPCETRFLDSKNSMGNGIFYFPAENLSLFSRVVFTFFTANPMAITFPIFWQKRGSPAAKSSHTKRAWSWSWVVQDSFTTAHLRSCFHAKVSLILALSKVMVNIASCTKPVGDGSTTIQRVDKCGKVSGVDANRVPEREREMNGPQFFWGLLYSFRVGCHKKRLCICISYLSFVCFGRSISWGSSSTFLNFVDPWKGLFVRFYTWNPLSFAE